MIKMTLNKLINNIFENDLGSLNEMHERFKPLILKYSMLLGIKYDELVSEFDMILLKIYKNEIEDEFKILKYIKTSFRNIKEVTLRGLDSLEHGKIDELYSDIIFFDLIKDLSLDEQKILELRFYKQYTFAEIGLCIGATKQAAHQRIKRAVKKINIA